MKKALLFSAILLALSASMASAGGSNFYWGDCVGDGGVINKSFDCSASSTTESAIGSFILSAPIPEFIAMEIVVDLQADSPSLPSWWDFTLGGCHSGSLSITGDFSPFANVTCTDGWQAVAQGGLAAYTPTGNRARILGVLAIDATTGQPLLAGVEYYGFRLALKRDLATGGGSCPGCNVPVTLVVNNLVVQGAIGSSVEVITNPATNNCITWQGGGSSTCSAVPAHNQTWGQVKSLYR